MEFIDLSTDIFPLIAKFLAPSDCLSLIKTCWYFDGLKSVMFTASDLFYISDKFAISITNLICTVRLKYPHTNTLCIVNTICDNQNLSLDTVVFNYYVSLQLQDDEYSLGLILIEYDKYASIKTPYSIYERTYRYISKSRGYCISINTDGYSFYRLLDDFKKYKHLILNQHILNNILISVPN